MNTNLRELRAHSLPHGNTPDLLHIPREELVEGWALFLKLQQRAVNHAGDVRRQEPDCWPNAKNVNHRKNHEPEDRCPDVALWLRRLVRLFRCLPLTFVSGHAMTLAHEFEP